jgi:MFS family permease
MQIWSRLQSFLSRNWLIATLVSLSYLLAFMQRTGPGVIANRLQTEFHVSSAVLGTMTSIQYLLYMLLQIPVGLFGDRFGPEKLLVTGVFLDGAGTLVFAHSHSFMFLLAGRAIVGIGDALIYVNIVLILGKRFVPQVFGSLLGIVGTAGNVGALLTTLPFAAWTEIEGWRVPFTILGSIIVVVAMIDFVSLGAKPNPEVEPSTHIRLKKAKMPTRKALALTIRDKVSWATFACHFGACGTYIGFVSLWAVPYFLNVYHVSQTGSTVFTLIAFIGGVLGGPIAGAVSDKMKSRRKPYIVLQAAATLAWATIPAWLGAPPVWISYLMMFIVGFVSGGCLLTFAVIRDQVPIERAGVVSGFANTGGFLSAVLLPVLFGGVLDWLSPSSLHGAGVPNHVYIAAFIVPTLFSLVGLLGSLAIPEQRKRGGRAFS